jgi:hypothetical protein
MRPPVNQPRQRQNETRLPGAFHVRTTSPAEIETTCSEEEEQEHEDDDDDDQDEGYELSSTNRRDCSPTQARRATRLLGLLRSPGRGLIRLGSGSRLLLILFCGVLLLGFVFVLWRFVAHGNTARGWSVSRASAVLENLSMRSVPRGCGANGYGRSFGAKRARRRTLPDGMAVAN